ncbi:MAG: SUMF1/EgtB/PvdO family nonheme iron enzyme [Saprospiraceae bacterium]
MKPTVGKNYLLAIAIDEYEHCASLRNCVKDAKAIVKVLSERYHFEHVIELYNPDATKRKIVEKLKELRGKIQKDVDNLVIYFSGHGETDREDDDTIGYLVPVEAQMGDESDYLPHSFFKDMLHLIKTKHTFVILDACFAGSFFHSSKGFKSNGSDEHASRWGLSSSLSHEVALDGSPGDNSPFAQCLVETLQESTESVGVHGLFATVQKKMRERNFSQKPICQPFSDLAKYKDGEFFFHPTQNETQIWAATEALATADAYYEFWKKYPDSPYSEEALWRYVTIIKTKTAYNLYLKNFQRGEYWDEAIDAIEDINDEDAWKEASSRNIDSAYWKYIRHFPKGKYVQEAYRRIEAISIHETPPPPIILPDPPKLIIPEGLVLVEGGSFLMGSNDYDREKPIHEVILDSFYIGKYPVTFEEYDAFCTATKRDKPDDEKWGRVRRPVINVNWYDAVAYCNWLSEQQNLQNVYTINGNNVGINWSANGYRLPTEAEWEYAARGGKKGKNNYKYAGSNDLDKIGWYWENAGDKRLSGEWKYERLTENNCKTHPVGEKDENELGIHDMSGNVWEWCWDLYDAYPHPPSGGTKGGLENRAAENPRGAEKGDYRVVRGGSWNDLGNGCRSTVRGRYDPGFRSISIGFRYSRAFVTL